MTSGIRQHPEVHSGARHQGQTLDFRKKKSPPSEMTEVKAVAFGGQQIVLTSP